MASKPGLMSAEIAMPSGSASGVAGCVMCFLLGRSDGFAIWVLLFLRWQALSRARAACAIGGEGNRLLRASAFDERDEFTHVASHRARHDAEFLDRQARAVQPERGVAEP